MATSGSLITRNYTNFLGVDFSNYKVNVFRSPDALNMWKNYKNLGKFIETRPGLKLYRSFDNNIYGIFFFKINLNQHVVVHCGVGLYDIDFETEEIKTLKANGMNTRKSQSFIHNNILYIKDGINYLQYDGIECKEVEGFIPTTSISRTPAGGGQQFQEVNLLTGYRKNSFVADGESTDYYLDTTDIELGTITIWINGSTSTQYSVDQAEGKITFNTPPPAPDTDGQDNVVIQFRKSVQGYRDRINKCTLLEVFDNRVFFSGNQNYPSSVFYSALDNPAYVSDLDYSEEGMDGSMIKSMVAGNNALWVFKEPSQANTTIFYHTPAIDSEVGKCYPSTHSNISEGCVSTAINFNDDIVMFSQKGLEGISGEIGNEQVLGHRSSLIDSKILSEAKYKDAIMQEWEGYLLVFIGNHVYLADTRQKFQNNTSIEYEWYYWELEKEALSTTTFEGKLYIGTDDGIYVMDSQTISKDVVIEKKTATGDLISVETIEETGKIKNNTQESTEVLMRNKNLCPYKTKNVSVSNTGSVNTNQTTAYYGIPSKVEVKPNTKYTITFKDYESVPTGITLNIAEWDENNTFIRRFANAQNMTFTTGDRARKVIVYLFSNVSATGIEFTEINKDVQLEVGESQTSYVEAESNEITLSPGETANITTYEGITNIDSDAEVELEYKEIKEIDLGSYWTTCKDDIGYTNYQKITNKKGCVADVKGDKIKISVLIDNGVFQEVNEYTNIKGYIVPRIKRKKWKDIQFKFSSNEHFGLYSFAIQTFIGAYVKR